MAIIRAWLGSRRLPLACNQRSTAVLMSSAGCQVVLACPWSGLQLLHEVLVTSCSVTAASEDNYTALLLRGYAELLTIVCLFLALLNAWETARAAACTS